MATISPTGYFTKILYLVWFGLVWLIAVGTTVTHQVQPETHTYILHSKHNHLSYITKPPIIP